MAYSFASQQLYDALHQCITSGKLLPGAQLPSEKMLAEKYNLSRQTVRKVLQDLCEHNLLEKFAGIGTFVKQRQPEKVIPIIMGIDHLVPEPHYHSKILQTINSLSGERKVYLQFLSKEQLRNGDIDPDIDCIWLMRESLSCETVKILNERNTPVLYFNHHRQCPGVSIVSVDHGKESCRAVTKLLRYGYRRIAIFYDRSYLPERAAGWENAYLAAGMAVPEELRLGFGDMNDPQKVKSFICNHDFDAFYFSAYPLFQKFVQSALPVMGEKLYHFPKIIFDDMSMVPEKDFYSCDYVQMPLQQMTQEAITYLLQKVKNPALPELDKVFNCSLIINQ